MFASIVMAASLSLMPMFAVAAAYKCTDAAGKVSFSDTPCANSAAKGEKIFERGAGYNPLNAEEKVAFRQGAMAGCRGPRNVCECVSDTLSETLTYEEVMLTIRNRNRPTSAMVAKSTEAVSSCRAKAKTP